MPTDVFGRGHVALIVIMPTQAWAWHPIFMIPPIRFVIHPVNKKTLQVQMPARPFEIRICMCLLHRSCCRVRLEAAEPQFLFFLREDNFRLNQNQQHR